MNDQTTRLAVGALIPALALVVALSVPALMADSLPDPIATHWDFGGTPDGSTERATFLAVLLGSIVVLGAAIAAIARRSDVRRGELGPPIGIVTFLQWVLTGTVVVTVLANADASTWQTADDLPVVMALFIPLFAIAMAAATTRLAETIGDAPPTYEPGPTLGTRRSERLVWFSELRVTWPRLLGTAIATIGIVVLLVASIVAGSVLLVAAAAVLMLSTVQVSADSRGLTVRYGPLRWPRTRIALDHIHHADVIDVHPMRHGGWGYRGSLRVLGRAAVVLRAGDGLDLHLHRDRRFVVTVDDPETGSAIINDLVAQSTTPTA